MDNLSPRHTPVNTLCTVFAEIFAPGVPSWRIDMVGIDDCERTNKGHAVAPSCTQNSLRDLGGACSHSVAVVEWRHPFPPS